MKVLACGKHDWYDSLPCPQCQPETTASYGHASDPTRYADDDWRVRTCDECGWGAKRKAISALGSERFILCRQFSCKVYHDDQTCPAFVPRKQP